MKTAIIIDGKAYAGQEVFNHPEVYELQFTSTFGHGTDYIDSSDAESLVNFIVN